MAAHKQLNPSIFVRGAVGLAIVALVALVVNHSYETDLSPAQPEQLLLQDQAVAAQPPPTLLAFNVDWPAIYALDYGGPKSTARADTLLSACAEAGLTVIPVTPNNMNNTTFAWIKQQIANHGLRRSATIGWSSIFGYAGKIPAADRTWYGGKTTPYLGSEQWIFNEALHTSFGNHPKQYYKYAVCPNYRGGTYDRHGIYFRYVRDYLAAVEPDFVVVDTEIFASPEEVEAVFPGMIKTCRTCKEAGHGDPIAGYRAGWQQWARDHVDIAREVNPDVKVYFFRDFAADVSPVLRSMSWDFHAYWPTASGDGPSPGFYDLMRFPVLGNPTLNMMKRLVQVSVADGYPWLWPTGTGMNATQVYASCSLLANAGAAGWAIYHEQPLGRSLTYDNYLLQLIAAGNLAFGYTPQILLKE